jgi:hypothetical protein
MAPTGVRNSEVGTTRGPAAMDPECDGSRDPQPSTQNGTPGNAKWELSMADRWEYSGNAQDKPCLFQLSSCLLGAAAVPSG